MSRNGRVPKLRMNYEPNQFNCEGWIKGKMVRKTFKSAEPRDVKVGESLHCDLQGPINEPSLNGSQFVLVIKDEKSCYRSV